MKIFQKNKGAAMVSVLIAIAFIGILSTSLMFMAYMNYLTKNTRHQSTDNFYTAEFALDELSSSLQQIAAEAPDITTAKINMADAIDPNGNGKWSDDLPVSVLMPHSSKDATIVLSCNAASGVPEYSTVGQFALNGVEVVATGKGGTPRDGYVSTIGTDIKIGFPSNGGGPLDIYDFSLICDSPYKGDGGDTIFNGCVYLQGVSGEGVSMNSTWTQKDALIVKDGMTAFLGKKNVINGDITVEKGGVLNVVGDFVVNGEIKVKAGGAVIGTGDFHCKKPFNMSSTCYVAPGITTVSDPSVHYEKLPDNKIPGGTPETVTTVPGRVRQAKYNSTGPSITIIEYDAGGDFYTHDNETTVGTFAYGSTEYSNHIAEFGSYPWDGQPGVPWTHSLGYTVVTSPGASGLTTKLFAKTVPLIYSNGSGWVSLSSTPDATSYNIMKKFSGVAGGYIMNGTDGTTYDSDKYCTEMGVSKASDLLLFNITTCDMDLRGTFYNSTMLSEVPVKRVDRSLPVYLQKMDKKTYNRILDSYYAAPGSSGQATANNPSSAKYMTLDGSGNLGTPTSVTMDQPLFPTDPLASLTAAKTLDYKDPNSDIPGSPAKQRTAEATSSNVNMLPMRAFLVDDTAAVIDQNFNINSSDPDSKESSVSYENWYKL